MQKPPESTNFQTIKQNSALSYIVLLFVPIIGLAVGSGAAMIAGLGDQPAGSLIVNAVFLLAVLSLNRFFKFTSDDLGLKLKPDRFGFHILASMLIFSGYMLFYIFVVRISSLKPIHTAMMVNLFTYLMVVVAEEVYFRGQVYSFIEKRFSAAAALIVSALLFGLFHARQGLTGMVTKSITGALWGSVRYTTGMVYLLIVPVHFAYNAAWLLFEGNWNNLPGWTIYAISAGELILTAVILIANRYSTKSK